MCDQWTPVHPLHCRWCGCGSADIGSGMLRACLLFHQSQVDREVGHVRKGGVGDAGGACRACPVQHAYGTQETC